MNAYQYVSLIHRWQWACLSQIVSLGVLVMKSSPCLHTIKQSATVSFATILCHKFLPVVLSHLLKPHTQVSAVFLHLLHMRSSCVCDHTSALSVAAIFPCIFLHVYIIKETHVPFLPQKADNRLRLRIEDRVALTTTAPWVTCPSAVLMHHSGRSFEVHVDPTGLPPGLHYAEVLGCSVDQEDWQGPMFRMPVTVVVPLQVSSSALSLLLCMLLVETGIGVA